jgi:serine phosphatase RsbU (regulator of sigma subunit)/anti-sigma regulatory factor (Ser/Thr protein kinase)
METVRVISVRTHVMDVECDYESVRAASLRARAFLEQAGLGEDEVGGWELVLVEAANNAVTHALPERKERGVGLRLLVTGELVEAHVVDRTGGFDFPENAELPPDDSESGRGLFIIQALTDEAKYLRGPDENQLILRKRRNATAPPPTPAHPDPASVPVSVPVSVPIDPPAESESRESVEARQMLEAMTEELASAYESLAAIFRFSSELQGEAGSNEFIQRWLRQLLTMTGADWFVLRLVDREASQLVLSVTSDPEAATGLRPAESIPLTSNGAECRAIVQRSDVWFDAQAPLAPDDPLAGFGRGGGFSHPLFVNDTLVGVFTIGRRDLTAAFEAGQVSVIQTIADFLGIQILSQRILEEQLRARVDARDFEIAANIQRMLLPQKLPLLPGASVAGFCRSARQIGGDYYDALVTDDGNLLLIMSDVMGKGLPAALFALMFRSLVRSRRDLAPHPGRFLAWLNQNLFTELDAAEMFITAQLAYIDVARAEIRVSGAGHPPMLLANAQGEVLEVRAGGPPLGILEDSEPSEETRSYQGGRALLFTDGLIEARNRDGELLGLEPIKVLLRNAALSGEPIDITRRKIVELLGEFENAGEPADDTALLVLAGNLPF